ncbi:phosphatidylinositol kinase [Algoriphagus sp. NBT04N3]|jgi:HipA-like protein|uniref:HipA N-terminal domain-containing protein n=1 Tax=Algoriphagus sp. NBT04N3 TaxID=2705473 RepID=UPI001C632DE1|nr:HipA N-terminal domain-containing protein [Algoriphagus sp. NBT04N3]QYH37653.1 phosphatidylinositol kinase [Algoriphagus sp. NBT04N3]
MKSARVLRNGELVGILSKSESGKYSFVYEDSWFSHPDKPSVSLTLPKSKKEYYSDHLFPFFFNMLSEGVNLKLQARQFQIDEDDFFTILLKTADSDTIGAITVEPND